MHHDRHGAKQPHRFDPARAHVLDDRARFELVPPTELFALLDAPHRARVVDFGTGTGTYAIELALARPDVEVIALDEQQAMLDRLNEKLAARPVPNIKPVMARSVEAVALEGHADRVLGLNVLHELGDDALGELRRLLRPGGRALFVDWRAEVERDVGPPKDHVYSPDEGASRVERFGFRVVSRQLLRYHYALLCDVA